MPEASDFGQRPGEFRCAHCRVVITDDQDIVFTQVGEWHGDIDACYRAGVKAMRAHQEAVRAG